MQVRVVLFPLLLLLGVAHGVLMDIQSYGAVAGTKNRAAALFNNMAVSYALGNASAGDIVVVPADLTFVTLGGIAANGLNNVTFRILGTLEALDDFDHWPHTSSSETDKVVYAHFLHFTNCSGLVVEGLSSGVILGRGIPWWDKFILGTLHAKRPKLLVVEQSVDIVVRGLRLHDSPSYHVQLIDVAHAEVADVHIIVDRKKQSAIKDRLAAMRRRSTPVDNVELLEPEDLNTDGIDPSGTDIWIHDCTIQNDDDSIAVKPCSADSCVSAPCSQNMLIENMVMTGFGASIGSVPPHAPSPHCVRNITFRNISMPGTGKGIYIKSNPECGGRATASITDILYEDIAIDKPRWWAIWIGPQQQHEPNQSLGDKCGLSYPIEPHCPTQGCVTFANITLRNVKITDPWLSPGVILGNSSNPMTNITFQDVVVTKPGLFPFKREYQCENAQVTSLNSTPAPCA